MIGAWRRFVRWKDRARCPECLRKGFREWHAEGDGFRMGGRFCPDKRCGYGVHPPEGLTDGAVRTHR